jgi:hypothetical protein
MNKKMITIIFVTVILLIVIVPFVLFLIPLFKNTSETYTDSDTTPTLAQLPTPPIPPSQNLLLSDGNGNLSIVNTDNYNKTLTDINTDLNKWATSLDQYVQKRLNDMQTQINGKVSYNDSISLALDHSQTAGKVPMYPKGSVLYNLAQIDENPKTRQYLSYVTQNVGSGQTPDGCFPGSDNKCNPTEPRPNIISGKPIDLNEDDTISNQQSSNFKIVAGLKPGQKL